jgi:hypothetical protein
VQGKDSTAYTGGLVGGWRGEAVEGGGGVRGRLTEPPKRGTGLSTQREREKLEDKRIDGDRIFSSLADTNQIVQRVLRQYVA